MADEADSKSVVGNHVWVQVPLPALKSLDFTGFFTKHLTEHLTKHLILGVRFFKFFYNFLAILVT